MLLELSLALFLGIVLGTITGLTPGLHINLIGSILVSSSIFFLGLTTPIVIVIFIVAMAITHTFVDFIPSIFLGAPDEDTILSILPGHELLKSGRGYEAIALSSYGSLGAIFIILLVSPLFIFVLPEIESMISILIPFLLITSTIFLMSKEKYKLRALIVFFLSGFLGVAVFSSNVDQPFLPLLSGLFGASSLIISIKTKTKIPKQQIKDPKIKIKKMFPPLFASIASAPLTSFLPGLGSGQAAIIGSSLIKSTKENFLIMLGAINTIVLGLSFIVYYSIGKTRTGMSVFVSEILKEISLKDILIILIVIVFTGIICFFWTLILARRISKHIDKVDYQKLSILIILFLGIVVFYFSGFLGLFIFLISTAAGIFGILSDVKRINLMGTIVLPVILFYLV